MEYIFIEGQIEFVTYKLKGRAAAWWNQFQNIRMLSQLLFSFFFPWPPPQQPILASLNYKQPSKRWLEEDVMASKSHKQVRD